MMGASVGGGSSRSRRGRRKRAQLAEINVTPFVDVMLVLLVIFMVAAPMLTVGVAIDLPETKAKQLNTPSQPLTISVNPQGIVFLQEEPIAMEEIIPRLVAISQNNVEERIYVRGDRAVDYGLVMQVMGRLNAAGFRRIALITQQEN